MSSASSVLPTRCRIKLNRRLLSDLIVLLILLLRSALIAGGIASTSSMYVWVDEPG